MPPFLRFAVPTLRTHWFSKLALSPQPAGWTSSSSTPWGAPRVRSIPRSLPWVIPTPWTWTATATVRLTLALNDYLRASGELKAEAAFRILVNGVQVADRKISSADVFNAPSRFEIDPKLIQDTNDIRIVRVAGDGGRAQALYFSANAEFFSTEEPVTPAGNEIFVKREYYKLAGRPTLLKGYVYDREPLRDGETVKSGERVETVVTIEGKNNYEYLMFEDLKPAGFEAVEIRSGENVFAKELKQSAFNRASEQMESSDYTDRTRWVYQELRDRKVALFIDHLPQGVWQVRYDFRAEVPGQFHALVLIGWTAAKIVRRA